MKKIFSTILFLFVCIAATAQMSEEQIISYFQKQKEAGKDEKQIAKENKAVEKRIKKAAVEEAKQLKELEKKDKKKKQ